MFKFKALWSRTKRAITAISAALFFGGGAVAVIAVLLQLSHPIEGTTVVSVSVSFWIFIIASAVLAFMGLQAYFEYKKRTYDPTWIFKFDNIFFTVFVKNALLLPKFLKNSGVI